MALVACKECGTMISREAKACPTCGAPPPREKPWLHIIIGLVLGAAIVSNIVSTDKPAKSATAAPSVASVQSQKTPEQLAETARKDREINIVLAGAERLKASMKKPETFQLTRATMIGGKVICYEYTARNSWNDQAHEYYVVSDAVSSNRAKDWNSLCAGKAGDDYTSVRAVMR